ncbi:MAG: hypothetical protein KDC98_22800 [Planctomycetes bacterium]|nr:hypothetical protein [Planctomycetota bacterium]
MDKRVVTATIVIVVAVVQAGLAGLAFLDKSRAERQLAEVRGRCDDLRIRIEMAEAAPLQEVQTTESKWRLAEPDVSRTLQIVQEIGDGVGVELTTLEVTKSKTPGKRTFRVTGIASPDRVCALVAGIEELEELVIVETGRLLPGSETEVEFELGLATYHVAQERGQ